MRKRANRLGRVLDLAKQEERSKLAAIGRVQQSLDESIDRLEELETYRNDYARIFKQGETLTPARWRDYQSFLSRIDEAVSIQKEQVKVGRENREKLHRLWMSKRQRLDSIERVMERHRKSLAAESERCAQRALDEMAALTGRLRRENLD